MKTLKEMNQEYLNIINSKEYKTGKYLNSIIVPLKKGKVIETFKNIKFIFDLKKIKKISKKSERYKRINVDIQNSKIAVYTVLYGAYDVILPIPYIDSACDYYILTDQKIPKNCQWKKLELTKDEESKISDMSNIEKNRYFKIKGCQILSKYDYTIYIDSNIEIYDRVSDLCHYSDNQTGLALFNHSSRNDIFCETKVCKILNKGNSTLLNKQVNFYKNEGFPHEFGMCECSVIIKNNSVKNVEKIMNDWWIEFMKWKSMRDQISFPYVIWKNNFSMLDIGCIGENIKRDGKFRKRSHVL